MSANLESMADRLARAPQQQLAQTSMSERLMATPGDFSAAFFGQAEFDRTSGLPFTTRLKVGAADTNAERQETFLRDFPEGRLDRVPVTGEMVFRFNAADETEPFKTVERDVPLELSFENVTREALEFGKDVSEVMINTVGPITGEIVAALATRGRSLFVRLAALAAGGGGGELAQEAVEAVVTVSDEPGAAIAARTGLSAVMGPAGFGLGAGAGRLIQGARGRGFLSASPEAREAMQSIEDINKLLQDMGSDVRVPQLSTGQAAEAPIFRRIEEQSAALTAPVRRQRQAQVEAIQKVLDESVDQRAIDLGRRAIAESYDAERNRLLKTISDPKVVLSKGGEALEKGIQRYDRAARVQIDTLYELARKIEQPEFALGNAAKSEGLLGAAARELRGVPAVARKFSDEETLMLKELGVPPSAFSRAEATGRIQVAPPDPEIESIASEMLLASPEQVSTEVLRSWRSRLWDLKQSPVGELPAQRQFQAQRLFTATNRVLDNPSNANPRFAQAWKTANARASDRFTTLEKAQVSRILKSGDLSSQETIEQLAVSLQAPFNASNLRFLKSVVSNDAYKRFTDSFKTRLLSDPGQIGRTLGNIDRETLQFLLSPAERKSFRTFGERLELLDSVGVQQQLKAQTIPREFLRGLIERGDTAGVNELRRLIDAAGGQTSQAGKAIRYSLLDVAFDKFIVDGEIQQLSKRAITDFMGNLRRMGFIGFLTEQDRVLINNLDKIAPFFRFNRGGAGASIQAAEAASGVVEGSSSAIWELIEKAGAGRVLINPQVRSFLLGRPGTQPIDDEMIRMFGAVSLTVLASTAETAAAVNLINGEIQ